VIYFMFINFIKKTRQRGAVMVIITLLVLSALFIASIGVAVIMLAQFKMASQSSESVRAYYAADSGAEKCFYQFKAGSGACGAVGGSTSGTFTFENGLAANYAATLISVNQIRSRGCFNSLNKVCRELELNW